MLARPRDPLSLPDAKEQLELLLEQLVVVGQVVTEQRERLGERPATGHDLGPPTGDEIQRREVLEYTNRVVRAEHGDGARQADVFGARGGSGKDDRRRGHDELGAVMLADPEDVEPDLIGELDLLEESADPLRRADRSTGPRVGRSLAEAVDAELHEGQVCKEMSTRVRTASEMRHADSEDERPVIRPVASDELERVRSLFADYQRFYGSRLRISPRSASSSGDSSRPATAAS